VKLSKTLLSSLPSQLSGGQKQRVAIARALASNPKLIIADEPTSSLDAPVKKEILEILLNLRKERDFTLILITHDLRVASQITDRLVFLYKGRIVEYGDTPEIINFPLHPYTKLLFSVIRQLENKHDEVQRYQRGSDNETGIFMSGCSYYSDCPIREEVCLIMIPNLNSYKNEHCVACHQVGDAKNIIPEN
jgi:oligopeptide/dipeptide ABC transporter ATP-binding protein